MIKPSALLKRITLLVGVGLVTMTNTGCILLGDFIQTAFVASSWVGTTPLIPVSPYYSELIEETYTREERYDKVPILPAVEGEHAPLFCQDPPQPAEIVLAMPNETSGGWTFLAETSRNNMRFTVEPMVDRIDECRFFPLAGPARLHHCHYKCTIYYDRIIRSDWPVPFRHKDEAVEVVYIDHDHLIQCSGPAAPQ